MKAQNRISDFLLTSLKLFGKEIAIPSNQAFEIDASSNAIKMLNIAINDLKHATVLRECQIDVPKESRRIPCAVSITEDIKEK